MTAEETHVRHNLEEFLRHNVHIAFAGVPLVANILEHDLQHSGLDRSSLSHEANNDINNLLAGNGVQVGGGVDWRGVRTRGRVGREVVWEQKSSWRVSDSHSYMVHRRLRVSTCACRWTGSHATMLRTTPGTADCGRRLLEAWRHPQGYSLHRRRRSLPRSSRELELWR